MTGTSAADVWKLSVYGGSNSELINKTLFQWTAEREDN